MARVLFVCTANRCRSPLAAAILREKLREHAEPFEVADAGIGSSGLAVTGETAAIAHRIGLQLDEHRSRSVTAADVARADLVIGLERRHVREVVALEASAWPKTFTLKELVRHGAHVEARGAGEPLQAWLMRLGAGRKPSDLLGAHEIDDVSDPTGGTFAEHADLAGELDSLLEGITTLLVTRALVPINWKS